ncbi:MAG: exosome complex RNA-binding protein Rrp4 [Thermoplasmatales archaeon]|nr:exosome complex RNA-binding protein Rrp4 [Thermoplasmatales archaeon]
MNSKNKKREIVLPGEFLGENLEPGPGVYNEGKQAYASVLGVKSVRANRVNVVPLSGRYIPKVHDCIIGTIIEVGPSSWLVDINSPYPALLHITESPWRVDFGDAAKFLNIGDAVLVKVSGVDEIKRVQVTMKDIGLRKITGGQLMEIPPSRIPRVIGKGGSMISLIKRSTKCRMFVGQNGRIWLDGGNVSTAVAAIKKIEKEAHTFGLTDAIGKYLEGK